MRIALVNVVTDRQFDFYNHTELKDWISSHAAFLSKKMIERFVLHRAEPRDYCAYKRCGVYCSLKDFIVKHKLL